MNDAAPSQRKAPFAQIALVDDPRFEAHVDRSGHHPESPDRLLAAREGLRAALGPMTPAPIGAREATDDELYRAHAPHYVDRLKTRLAAGGHGLLDPDTYFSPGTREAAWLAAGGIVDMTRRLVQGSEQRGVALLRPPGHHAIASSSMGFCLLNNVAIAAHTALASGLSRVAIVDWDVHHGNGTQDIFYQDPRVLFISLHQYPFYPGTGAPYEVGEAAGAGHTANVALPADAGPEAYGAAFRRVVLPLLRAYAPELVLVSAGFDAHERDPLASMNLDQQTYGALASSLLELVDEPSSSAQGRIAFVLEGGYDLYALRDSVHAVGSALVGHHTALPEGRVREREQAAIEQTRACLAQYWNHLPL
ncbi:MAG: histone deacetylase [Polyangiales bacterium]